MSIIDRIRAFFGGKPSGLEYGTVTGGAVAATDDDPARDVEPQPDLGGSESGGWGDGDGDGSGGSS